MSATAIDRAGDLFTSSISARPSSSSLSYCRQRLGKSYLVLRATCLKGLDGMHKKTTRATTIYQNSWRLRMATARAN